MPGVSASPIADASSQELPFTTIGPPFNRTSEFRRVAGAVRAAERAINSRATPASVVYVPVDVQDYMALFETVTTLYPSPRNSIAHSFADAMFGWAASRPRIYGRTAQQRKERAEDSFEHFLQRNVPPRLMRFLRSNLRQRFNEIGDNFLRLAERIHGSTDMADLRQENEFLSLAAQANVISDALFHNRVSLEELIRLDGITKLMVNAKTERIGSGLLLFIIKDSRSRLRFPPHFDDLIEAVPLLQDSKPAMETDISTLLLLDMGEYALAHKFFEVAKKYDAVWNNDEVVPAEMEKAGDLRYSLNDLAHAVIFSGELSSERWALVIRSLDLTRDGAPRALGEAERIPGLLSVYLGYPAIDASLERDLGQLLDRLLNPSSGVLQGAEDDTDAAMLVSTVLEDLIYLNQQRPSEDQRKYALANSAVVNILGASIKWPLNGARMVLMVKSLRAEMKGDYLTASYYMGPLVNPNAQYWLNGLTGVSRTTIDRILEMQYYSLTETTWGGGGPQGSTGGAAPGSSAPPETPPAPTNPNGGPVGHASSVAGLVDVDTSGGFSGAYAAYIAAAGARAAQSRAAGAGIYQPGGRTIVQGGTQTFRPVVAAPVSQQVPVVF